MASYWLLYRKGGLRSAEELQRTIVDIETKYKAELGRAKKKYETDFRELEIQNENLNRANNELAKANKSLAGRVKVTRAFVISHNKPLVDPCISASTEFSVLTVAFFSNYFLHNLHDLLEITRVYQRRDTPSCWE